MAAGRKRKVCLREPSGKVARVGVARRANERRELAEFQPHRRTLPENVRLDQRAESVLGRMNLTGEITDQQYDAGKQFATIVAAYRAVVQTPNPFTPSAAGGETRGRSVLTEDECIQRKEHYNRAYEAMNGAGQRATSAVESVVVHERPAGTDIVYLRYGLNLLAKHFYGGCMIRRLLPK